MYILERLSFEQMKHIAVLWFSLRSWRKGPGISSCEMWMMWRKRSAGKVWSKVCHPSCFLARKISISDVDSIGWYFLVKSPETIYDICVFFIVIFCPICFFSFTASWGGSFCSMCWSNLWWEGMVPTCVELTYRNEHIYNWLKENVLWWIMIEFTTLLTTRIFPFLLDWCCCTLSHGSGSTSMMARKGSQLRSSQPPNVSAW